MAFNIFNGFLKIYNCTNWSSQTSIVNYFTSNEKLWVELMFSKVILYKLIYKIIKVRNKYY